MKKLVLIILISAAFVAGTTAQKKFENNPKVHEARKSFYNQELSLTEVEQDVFWPIFNAMRKDEQKLKKKYIEDKNEIIRRGGGESKEILDLQYEFDLKKAALKNKYINEFSKVISIRKVIQLEDTERKFKRKVLKQIRRNRSRRGKASK